MPPKNAGGGRGVSAEEKRQRMLDIFKSAEVFNMKELEKLGAKLGWFQYDCFAASCSFKFDSRHGM